MTMTRPRPRFTCMKWIPGLLLLLVAFAPAEDFKTAQKKYERVRKAYSNKEKTVQELLKKQDLSVSDISIFIRAFKKEGELELWAKSSTQSAYKLVKTYEVCAASGDLGPKRKRGDGQVPEGFYRIDRFNPASSFHLSLGVNYPNASDQVLSDKNPGGDIFIHGNCVTIGCLPMTDPLIEEIYVLAVEARNNGQASIPVHIFPFRLSDSKLDTYSKEYPAHTTFWKNLQKGYAAFEKDKKIPKVTVDKKGNYIFS